MDSRSLVTDRAAEQRHHATSAMENVGIKVSDRDSSKIVMPGTDRARRPEETLPDALRWAELVGVTRLGDVTHLDTLGIPTYQAVRPNSKTLTVSQGKGLTDALAQVSALMESIELWHAECAVVTPFRSAPGDLRHTLGYDPYRDLPLVRGSFLHDALPLDWVFASRLADSGQVPVPHRLVTLDFTAPERWRPRVYYETSNGLASGNTYIEATLHGLYEVVERDAITRASLHRGSGRRFDPQEIGSEAVGVLLDRFSEAGALVSVRWLPSPTGLPCVNARIVSPDYPMITAGYGCHLRMEVAAVRALTEAAQSRTCMVSGARDDITRSSYSEVYEMSPAPRTIGPELSSLPFDVLESTSHGSLYEDLADVVSRCVEAFSHSPLVVDLTHPRIGVPVVRVIVPGCLLGEDLL